MTFVPVAHPETITMVKIESNIGLAFHPDGFPSLFEHQVKKAILEAVWVKADSTLSAAQHFVIEHSELSMLQQIAESGSLGEALLALKGAWPGTKPRHGNPCCGHEFRQSVNGVDIFVGYSMQRRMSAVRRKTLPSMAHSTRFSSVDTRARI